MYNFKYGRKMRQKLFIMATKGKIEICIELNVIEETSKINWIVNRTNGNDNFINTLGTKQDAELIQQAEEFAKGLKQYTEIIEKYN